MNRVRHIVRAALVCACLVLSPDVLGGLTIISPPQGNPPLWEIFPDENCTDCTVKIHGDLMTFSTVFVIVGSGDPIISEIDITRPPILSNPPTPNHLTVSIGQFGSPSGWPSVVEWIHTTDTFGDFVEVQGFIGTRLEEVENVNFLFLQVGKLATGGDVTGPISCVMHPTATTNGGGGIRITSTHGNLTGDVVMRSNAQGTNLGPIIALDFQNGTIGAPGSPVNILADEVIQGVTAKKIHANMKGTNADPGNPALDSYVSMIGDVTNTESGPQGFTGEIRAETMGVDDTFPKSTGLHFAGGVTADIWLQSIPAAVGANDNDIIIPAGEFSGIVGLRAVNPNAALEWEVPVKFVDEEGKVVFEFDQFDANGYTPPQLASELGGGSVGVVAFPIHREDCVPAHGDAVTAEAVRPNVDNPIRVRFYGPVTWDPAPGNPPLKVERRRYPDCPDQNQCYNSSYQTNPPCGGSAPCWVDVTCAFTQTADTDPANNNSVVILTPIPMLPDHPKRPLQRGFQYRVSPMVVGGTTVLRSDVPHLDVASDPPVSTDNPLFFTVCTTAATGDADDNGVVNFADITSVLANFGYFLCMPYGDADRDGDSDFADVTAVLANFGSSPCPELGVQSILARADGMTTMDLEQEEPMSAFDAFATLSDALRQMGYASVEEFGNALDSMPEEQRNAEIRRLGQLLEQSTQE